MSRGSGDTMPEKVQADRTPVQGVDCYDVSKVAGTWNHLQTLCVAVTFVALHAAASLGIDVVKFAANEPAIAKINWADVSVMGLLFLLASYVGRATWTHSATASLASLNSLRLAHRIVLYTCSIICGLGIGMAIALNGKNEALEISAWAAVLLSVLGVVYALWMLGVIRRILKADPFGLEIEFASMLKAMERFHAPEPPAAKWHVRIDRPAGFLWFALGIGVFIAGAAILDYAWTSLWDKKTDLFRGLSQAGAAMEALGAWCIFKGRTYFVPTGEAVLAIDKRPPVLYLRSFSDEKGEHISYRAGGLTADRSLEMKLSKYFRPFAPFLAIGSPRDKLPKLGAIRLERSDSDWQREVGSLMGSARWIVASVGTSNWIKWEVAEVMGRGYGRKALFLFPSTVTSFWRPHAKRKAQEQERLSALMAAVSADKRLPADAVPAKTLLLAAVLQDQKWTLITCKAATANAYLLATALSHFLLQFKREDR